MTCSARHTASVTIVAFVLPVTHILLTYLIKLGTFFQAHNIISILMNLHESDSVIVQAAKEEVVHV